MKTFQIGIVISFALFVILFLKITHKQSNTITTLQERIITNAGVSYADSVKFERNAENVKVLDMPEELPELGDSLCAWISHDTMFVEYYHGHANQKNKFKYLHGY